MSKTVLPLTPEDAAPEHWRSLDHKNQVPAVLEAAQREFPDGASELDEPSRRSFMGVMGAGLALAGVGMTGCMRRPEEHIIPYQKMPEHVIPGIPEWYATSHAFHGEAVGILVESHEGRPTKIEGNPDHPSSLGGAMPWMQGIVLDLYDPDRLRAPRIGKDERSWADARAALLAALAEAEKSGGAKLRLLTETSTSPSAERLRREVLKRFPQAKFHVWDPMLGSSTREATKLAFGQVLRPIYALDGTKAVLTVDADVLGTEPGSVVQTKRFARARRAYTPQARMTRLWSAEPAFTVTGMNADHRIRMHAAEAQELLLALAAELAKKGVTLPGALAAKAKPSERFKGKVLETLAKDLVDAKGAAIVLVGTRQPPAVQALGYALNDALGSTTRLVRFVKVAGGDDPVSDLKTLVADAHAGKVDTLLILSGNPVYSAPGDLDVAGALGKIGQSFHLTAQEDETSAKVKIAIPKAHELESWGDLRAHDSTLSVVQPLIAPMFGGKSEIELLALVATSKEQKGHDLVRETFREVGAPPPPPAPTPVPAGSAAPAASGAPVVPVPVAPASGSAAPATSASAAPIASAVASAAASAGPDERLDKPWRRAIHDGVVRQVMPAFASDVKLDGDAVAKALPAQAPAFSAKSPEVTFAPDMGVLDGRYTNVAWLCELPNPVTKTVWENVAWISTKLATELGIDSGDVIRVAVGQKSIDIPAWIVPGNADYSITLSLGWGRKTIARVADGKGVDVSPIRTSASPGFGVLTSLSKTSARQTIVVTQEHNSLEGRPIVQSNTLEGLRKHPDFTKHAVHHPALLPLWEPYKYEGYKWGLVIDMTACTGCSACVIACQAENNIPTVGKEQVARQREMHWIRIDRYFSGSVEEPSVVHQPMACQQCENAPCENVCPVAATTHSAEGLNEMVYNRCIGTRYCSNNCPYKVRRFNFLDFHEAVPETIKMASNPNVSVRMRGVMEKCTYCVQRIQSAKIASKRENRKVRDGEIKTACQQSCPADAIFFGDLNDKASQISRVMAVQHRYAVLEELNAQPRTTYIARITNPHPDLVQRDDAAAGGHAAPAGSADHAKGGH